MSWPAKYPGECHVCEGRIHVDDPVKWADSVVIHAGCDVLNADLKPMAEACPDCFQVPATNGTCGCES